MSVMIVVIRLACRLQGPGQSSSSRPGVGVTPADMKQKRDEERQRIDLERRVLGTKSTGAMARVKSADMVDENTGSAFKRHLDPPPEDVESLQDLRSAKGSRVGVDLVAQALERARMAPPPLSKSARKRRNQTARRRGELPPTGDGDNAEE